MTITIEAFRRKNDSSVSTCRHLILPVKICQVLSVFGAEQVTWDVKDRRRVYGIASERVRTDGAMALPSLGSGYLATRGYVDIRAWERICLPFIYPV